MKVDDLIAMLDRPVTDYPLSVRVLCCLKSADINTLRELVRLTETDLLKFRNFGKKSISELSEFIKDHDLTWGMNVWKWNYDEVQDKDRAAVHERTWVLRAAASWWAARGIRLTGSLLGWARAMGRNFGNSKKMQGMQVLGIHRDAEVTRCSWVALPLRVLTFKELSRYGRIQQGVCKELLQGTPRRITT